MLQLKYFDSVRILSVDYDALLKSIKEVSGRIREKYNHVKKILLFGSFLRENYTPDSDVDILILVDEDDTSFIKRRDLFKILYL
ncbi:nucleotidyltransferase domain-containing protein [Thermodesulfobacteriota bacterium]